MNPISASTVAIQIQQPVVRNRLLLGCEYFGFGIIPVLSLAFINDKYDIWILSVTFGIAFLIVCYRTMLSRTWSWYELGFRLDNLWSWKVIRWYVVCAVIGCVTIFYCRNTAVGNYDPAYDVYLKYSVIGSAMQEFLYRVYLFKLGEELFTSKLLNFLSNVLLFTGMHWFFPNPELVLTLVFAGGILFTLLYMEFNIRNFFLIFLVHLMVNATAIKSAIFKEKQKTGQSPVFSCFSHPAA